MTEFLSSYDILYTAKQTVNIRAEASMDAEILGELQPNEVVLIEEAVTDDWASVYYMDGDRIETAFIRAEFLENVDASSDSRLLEKLSDAAQSEKNVTTEAETNKGETDKAEAGESETDKTEAAEAKTDKAEAAEAETDKSEAAEAETDKAEAAEAKTDKAEAAEAETDKAEAAEAETDKAEAGEAKTDKAEAAEAETDKSEAAEAETDKSEANEAETDETETDRAESDEAETEANLTTEEASDGAAAAFFLAEDAEAQFDLAKQRFPEVQTVGILYSADNQDAQEQLEDYRKLAEEYGLTLTARELEEAIDIDLDASELVGMVDCIFCIDDAVIDPLVPTIRAYAAEVDIPVIGIRNASE
jgi:uncharacterized protein YgiM (DUF1202 family)